MVMFWFRALYQRTWNQKRKENGGEKFNLKKILQTFIIISPCRATRPYYKRYNVKISRRVRLACKWGRLYWPTGKFLPNYRISFRSTPRINQLEYPNRKVRWKPWKPCRNLILTHKRHCFNSSAPATLVNLNTKKIRAWGLPPNFRNEGHMKVYCRKT